MLKMKLPGEKKKKKTPEKTHGYIEDARGRVR